MTDTLNAKSFNNPSIAIIGMGSIFPDATGLKRYWQLLRTSHDAIRPLPDTHWKADDYLEGNPNAPKGVDHVMAATGGFLEPVDFDPTEFGIPPTILEATDTAQLLALMAAREALETAGYHGQNAKKFDRSRVSVVSGATGAQELTVTLGARLAHPKWRQAMREAGIKPEVADELAARIAEQFVPWQENSFPGLLGNVIAGRIANRLDLRGTNCATDAACASSLTAVHLAMMELETGRCDMALAGGCDAFNDIFMFMCFSKTHALSPTAQIKPFADNAGGTILGEGIGMILLKRLEDAQRDGDPIFAVIRGLGTSSDGKSLSIYAPSSQGQQACLRNAYAMANISPTDVTLVEAHGTGTKVGDATEFEANSAVYSQANTDDKVRPWCAIGSVKSQIGHGKAAAGIASLIKTALALHHKVLPGTIKVERPHPNMDFENSPFYVNTATRPWFHNADKPRRAGVSSFGFGGSNFHAVLEESATYKSQPAWDGTVQMFAFSGDTLEDLKFKLNDFVADSTTATTGAQLDWLAQTTRQAFVSTAKFRLVFVSETTAGQTPTEQATAALARIDAKPDTAWHEDNMYYGVGAPNGKLAVLFPGQGSQYVNMGKDILMTLPESFNTVNNAKGPEDAPMIADVIFPRPTFDKALRSSFENRLNQTQYTQPALAAVNLAMWRGLEYFNICPDFAAGHSFGELAALCAAGMISPEDLSTLALERGRLMSHGDGKGAMLAVSGSLEAIEQMLQTEKLDLVLANRNSPVQGVLSGAVAQIDAAQEACAKHGLRCTRLNVSGAFHSPMMQSAYDEFVKTVNATNMLPGNFPVFANVSAEAYPADAAQKKSLLASQLINPVRFVELVRNLADAGVTTFVECGPKTVLSKLTAAILKDSAHTCLSMDSSAGRKSGTTDLARTLAQLAALGYAVALDKWEDAIDQPVKQKMTVKLSGVNYRDQKNLAPKRTPIEALTAQTVTETVYVQQPLTGQATPVAQATQIQTPVQQSFASIQEVQRLASEAHQKYLDTQTQIQQTLQLVLQHQAGGAVSFATPLPAPQPAAPKLVTPVTPTVAPQPAPIPAPTPQVAAPQPNIREKISAATSNVIDTMMNVVADLTGYPKDMLDLDMDMEADLGIDSIKRVEILAAIQKRIPGLPQVSSAVLGSLRTLREVAGQFKISESSPVSAAVAPVTKAVTNAANNVIDTMMNVVADLTGYPKDMLDLDMDMEADLGIDSIKRVEILAAIQKRIPGLPQVSSAVLGSLRTLREVAEQFKISENSPAPAAVAPVASAAANATGNVIDTMMKVVADLTGYPKEMLDLDMDMEADLGIDSIKRVEILAAIQKRIPGLPQVSSAVLGSLRTLREVAEQFKINASAPSAKTATPSTVVTNAAKSAMQTATAITQVGAAGASKMAGDLYDVIANLTGYPNSMLEPGMDMEADLGIDSIKRVEILAALQKRVPGLPQISSAALGGLRTLQEILDYMAGNAGTRHTTKPTAPVATAPQQPAPAGADSSACTEALMASVAELTGYPKDMLEADMDLEADLGIDSIKRVEILADMQKRMPNIGSFNANDMSTMKTLGEIAAFLAEKTPNAAAPDAAQPVVPAAKPTEQQVKPLPRRVPTIVEIGEPATAAGTMTQGTIVIFAQNTADGNALAGELNDRGLSVKLITEPEISPQTNINNISALVILASATTTPMPVNSRFLHDAFLLTKKLGAQLQTAGANSMRAVFATISWQGGQFGFDKKPSAVSTEQGGLAGMVKTAAIEWPGVVCRAIDCATDTPVARIADELAQNTPGEIGLTPDCRYDIDLPAVAPGAPINIFSAGDVVIVTGGARGVTVPCVRELAKFTGCDLLLLGRSVFNAAEPSWLQGITEEGAIKRALMQHAFAGEKPTPAMVNKECKHVHANREIAATLAELKSAGIRAEYHAVDVRDTATLNTILDTVRASKRRVAGIVHAAGVIEDRLIIEKTAEQFDKVVQTKVEGLQSLLDATANDTLKLIAFFSSVSARFGNRGQIDYAAANEVLNKTAQYLAKTRPACRVVSLNWGPWEAGMVTPQLKQHFESQGIAVIKLTEGSRAFVADACQQPGTAPVEVVLGHGFESLVKPTPQPTAKAKPMTDLFTAKVSADDWEFLNSHKLAERPVLPVCMSLEVMAYVAMSENPGLNYIGLDKVRVLKGIAFEGEHTQFSVFGHRATKEGADVFRMAMETRLADGRQPGTRGELLLSSAALPMPSSDIICPRVSGTQTYSKEQIYSDMLFHGSHFQGIKAVYDLTDSGLTAWGMASPQPAAWMNTPMRPQWITDPLCVDLALQIGIIWCIDRHKVACLPSNIEAVRLFSKPAPGSELLLQFINPKFDGTIVFGTVRVFEAPTSKPVMVLNNVEWTANSNLLKAFGKVQA